MKYGSTLFLRAVLLLLAAIALLVMWLILSVTYTEWSLEFPTIASYIYVIKFVAVATAGLFTYALYQAKKLLDNIDDDKAFSSSSLSALRNIKYSAVAMSALYVLNMPAVYVITQSDDAPGLIVLGALFTCAPIVVAVFAAVVQRLLKSVIKIKRENELTV